MEPEEGKRLERIAAEKCSRALRIKVHNLDRKDKLTSPENPANAAWLDRVQADDAPELEQIIASTYQERERLVGELLDAVDLRLQQHCGCFSSTDEEWHSSKCIHPKLRAAAAALRVAKEKA